MSMNIVDEINTPGCPQCAIKHLSAAIAYAADDRRDGCISNGGVAYARAKINLAEVLTGYKSHLWYAVGLLVKCEERFAAVKEPDNPDPWTANTLRCYRLKKLAREARLLLELHPESVAEAYDLLDTGRVYPCEMAHAHACEAMRELPAMADRILMRTPGDYYGPETLDIIEEIRKEFFDLPPSTVPGGEETNQTEKEPDMATAKKTAPKGTKCAAKGGKTAKATKCACKGGKTAKAKK